VAVACINAVLSRHSLRGSVQNRKIFLPEYHTHAGTTAFNANLPNILIEFDVEVSCES